MKLQTSIQQSNNPTIQQSNNSAIQQSNNPTNLQIENQQIKNQLYILHLTPILKVVNGNG
jgi:hypothetical protein